MPLKTFFISKPSSQQKHANICIIICNIYKNQRQLSLFFVILQSYNLGLTGFDSKTYEIVSMPSVVNMARKNQFSRHNNWQRIKLCFSSLIK